MNTRRVVLNTLSVAILLTLGACGGGGDGGPAPGPTIDIGLANYVTVGRATAAGISGVSPTGMMVPLGVSKSGPGRVMAMWLHPLSKRVALASAQRLAPLAVYGPSTYACSIGGTVTETDYDNDNSGDWSVGDSATFNYNKCQDTLGETSDGTWSMTITQASASSGSAHLAFSNMSYVTPRHSMTLNGSTDYVLTTPSPTVETYQTTSSGSMTIALSTHTGYTDTVTLLDGFVVYATYDEAVGTTVSTASGLLQSQAAGGVVQVNTPAATPLKEYDADAYPSSGTMQVKGMSSSLLITAVSATDVRLDVDANGDGTFESGSTMLWDDLL
jgi:hypothetical protein